MYTELNDLFSREAQVVLDENNHYYNYMTSVEHLPIPDHCILATTSLKNLKLNLQEALNNLAINKWTFDGERGVFEIPVYGDDSKEEVCINRHSADLTVYGNALFIEDGKLNTSLLLTETDNESLEALIKFSGGLQHS